MAILRQLGSSGQEVVRHRIVPDGYAVRAAPVPLPSPAFFGTRRIGFDIRSRNLSGQGMLAMWTAGRRAFPETTTTLAR